MTQSKPPGSTGEPVLYLKTLALRDDPLVPKFRDIHYQIVIDSLQASGQRIASGERVVPLSDAKRTRLLKQQAGLSKRICKKYKINGFHGGDPYLIKSGDWIATLRVSENELLRVETNWKTSFSPAVQFHVLPKTAKVYPSESGTLYQLPSLPKRLQTSPPLMTIHLDLSQVKPNALTPLTEEFKKAVTECLKQLPQSHRKPSSIWKQNVERDYRRFQQHFDHGIPYRWIAIYERSGAMPKRRVQGPVPTESSVRESVERVHLILFRKKISTSRRSHKPIESTLLATTLKQFNCPDHGRECPNSCPYGQDFIKNLQHIR
ncbi:MAG: hypothetical protein FJY85_13675 [Deltaproteobacteria bacterium]|nr:hypothetical protein [Deltaproteobacteria bacterium]MBM4138181.1 hypothetical protein [Nitrospira sp.]